MKIKNIVALILVLVISLSMVGCGNKEDNSSENDKEIDIAVMGGGTSFACIEIAKKEVEKQGYKLNVKTFDDFLSPNVAVYDEDVDLNFYQHEPFLNEYNKNKNTDLVKVGNPVYTFLFGIYSKKLSSLEGLKDGANVAIYNDSSNRTMALKILDEQGLIKVNKDKEQLLLTDIEENPKNLKFIEMDGPKVPTALDDVDIIVGCAVDLFEQGISANTLVTYTDEDFAWVLVAKKANANSKKAQVVQEALTSDAVKEFIEERYEGAVVPLF